MGHTGHMGRMVRAVGAEVGAEVGVRAMPRRRYEIVSSTD